MFLEDLALAVETGGRSHTRVGQLSQRGQTIDILGSVNIHIDIGLLGHLKGIGHLEAVTTCYAEAGEQLVEVCTAIR